MKYIFWIALCVLGILLIIFSDKIFGAIAVFFGAIGAGTNAIKEAQEAIIENKLKKIDEEKVKIDLLNKKEAEKLKELERAKKDVDAMSIDDLVEYGNKRSSKLRSGK